MANKKVILITDCIKVVIDDDSQSGLISKFADYHLKNWDGMPCLRGLSIGPNYYEQVFLKDAKEKIEEFFKNEDLDYDVKNKIDEL